MVTVAQCESGFIQFNKDGSVFRGVKNPKDVGIFQINEPSWLKKSIELGYNIYTIEGNIQMARWIHDNAGISQWRYSSGCWGNQGKAA